MKFEDVYLKGYANMAELMVGLAQYFAFYNAERPHQSLGYQTPDQVYLDGVSGGALIVDRFGDEDKCIDMGDQIPTRSLPFFRARLLLSTLLNPVSQLSAS